MSKADETASVPTEEQVKAANEAEDAKWQGDYREEDLTVPYKLDENGKASAIKSDGKKLDLGKTEGETEEEETEEEVAEEQEQVETFSEPSPVVTVQNPGEYKPADYSFEVTLKDGKFVKVSTPEKAEELADDPDNFETPKQLMDFINKQNKMNRSLERDYEKWEADTKTFQEQSQTETQRRETLDTFAGEFDYLVGKKLLPPIDKGYRDADWSDPQVAKQPGVKEQIALLNYMTKENEVRARAKVKPITSVVDAFNAWTLDKGRQKQDEDNKVAGEARKVAGAKVAGVSPTQTGAYVPKGIAVGNPNVFKRSAAVWDN